MSGPAWSPARLPDVSDPAFPPLPVNAATILGTYPAWWLDGSAGTFTDVGSGVCSQWADSSGNARTFTFGSGARPTILTAGLNGKGTLKFTSAQFGGNAAYASPAPGTTLSYFFAIARIGTAGGGPKIMISQAASPGNNIYDDSGTHIQDNNGSVGPVSTVTLANGIWVRLEVLRSNSGTDYVAINGTAGTAGNAGNTASTGVYLNANSIGGSAGDWEFAEAFQWTGAVAPTVPMRAALAAYSLAKWGV